MVAQTQLATVILRLMLLVCKWERTKNTCIQQQGRLIPQHLEKAGAEACAFSALHHRSTLETHAAM